MGIDKTALELILLSQKYVKHTDNANILTLGRQQIHIFINDINQLLDKYKFNSLINQYSIYDYSENLFKNLFQEKSKYHEIFVDSIDNSDYEGASIIHNLNNPFNSSKKYQYTTEVQLNIFSIFHKLLKI